MKVVTPKTMSDLENKAYEQGFSEKDFMEKAGKGIAHAVQGFIAKHHLIHKVWLLCGKGNNAGDAFVAGCHLLDAGYEVTAIQPIDLELCSSLCRQNGERFLNKKGGLFKSVETLGSEGIILDGIFGTGFKGQVQDPFAALIDLANQSQLPILAIDIPSGLNGTTGQVEGKAIYATETIFLGLPKIGCFLGEGWNLTGKLQAVDFGLPETLVEASCENLELTTFERCASLIPPIKRNRHKYQTGYVVGIAGSPSMPGAALLSSLAAFRGGCGIVRLLYPFGMEAELSSSPYELIKTPYHYDKPEIVIQLLNRASAVFLGPGLGRSDDARCLLKKIIPQIAKPMVMDADALMFYAEQNFSLPKQTILTPHTGEMQALLGSDERLHLNFSLLLTCQEYCEKHQVTLILKGAPTFIFHPNASIFINPTGDAGMATAGSGDVLTGLLASLLSQGLDCHNAAIVGVYLHGLAGEYAFESHGSSRGLMAHDLIEHFAQAYHTLLTTKEKFH